MGVSLLGIFPFITRTLFANSPGSWIMGKSNMLIFNHRFVTVAALNQKVVELMLVARGGAAFSLLTAEAEPCSMSTFFRALSLMIHAHWLSGWMQSPPWVTNHKAQRKKKGKRAQRKLAVSSCTPLLRYYAISWLEGVEML